MASEREKAKKAIKTTESKDPELTDALASASELQHKITAENNRHKEALQQAELGWVGRLLGGDKIAPIAIASLVVLVGLLGAALSGYAASESQRPDSADFWSKMVERSIAMVLTGLSFIFGRTGRR